MAEEPRLERASSFVSGRLFGSSRSAARKKRFNPTERLHRAHGSGLANIRLSRRSSFQNQDPKDVELSARKATDQFHLPSTDTTIALTGGVKNHKEGMIYVKSSGPISWLTGWKKKYLKLEKGEIKFFSPREIISYGPEEAVDEASIALVDIRWIEYEKRGDDKFAIVLGSQGKKKLSQARKASSGFADRIGTQRESRSTMSSKSSRDTLDIKKNSEKFRQTRVWFRLADPSGIENWIQHLLVELKNQAQFINESVKILMKQPGDHDESIEMMLRQSVDLWTLCLGKISEETAKAQESLVAWLARDLMNNQSEEAQFWAKSAQGIRREIENRNAIMRNWERVTGDKKGNLTDALARLRAERKATSFGKKFSAFEELQEETALFGISNAEHRIQLNEVEKWKMMNKGKASSSTKSTEEVEKLL